MMLVISSAIAFVGIESRGFIIATALALYYKKPFIMIRKAWKTTWPYVKDIIRYRIRLRYDGD